MFVAELIRNRRISVESQERLRALVETSPAAIVTVDDGGHIELANRAAIDLMAPRGGRLLGQPIAAFLPELHHALRWEEAPQFRASMQCRGHRGDGETFVADVWFSTYKEGFAPKLAAIIGELTEEAPPAQGSTHVETEERMSLNNRELEVLRCVVQGLPNKQIAALQQIFTKSGVRSRSQLVSVALEHYRSLL